MKKILVVGLGLIGGSMAMALRGFEDFEVVGAVRSQSTYSKAAERHAADRLTFDPAGELPGADVVVLCQDPAGIIGFLREHRDRFKPGCLIWDVCGVKTAVMEAAQCLPAGVDFIGCHPMAGKEVSGIDNAEGTLFRNTHFIVTPGPAATAEHLELLRRMADHCRFGDVIITTPERHDEMIAYTSQLMHVIAVSVCADEGLFSCKGFEGLLPGLHPGGRAGPGHVDPAVHPQRPRPVPGGGGAGGAAEAVPAGHRNRRPGSAVCHAGLRVGPEKADRPGAGPGRRRAPRLLTGRTRQYSRSQAWEPSRCRHSFQIN